VTVGQKPKLTPAVHKKIVDAVRGGNFYRAAAAYAGISETTLHVWIRRGRAEQERLDDGLDAIPLEARYASFQSALVTAEAESQIDAVANWKSMTTEDWRAAKEWLARRHSDEWGDKSRVEVSGPEGAPITLRGLADLMLVDPATPPTESD
jgi:transposase-like protein